MPKETNDCPFCRMDESNIWNTVLYETRHFKVIPAVGSLVDGYIIVISKRHISSMTELDNYERCEYSDLVMRFRDVFKSIYGRYPMVFEHGSPDEIFGRASSVDHAHVHIVNHRFKDEETLIGELNLERAKSLENLQSKKNYIMYMSPDGIVYVTYKFEPKSQLMRIKIADDLKLGEKFDWRRERFDENIKSTVDKIQKYLE